MPIIFFPTKLTQSER